MFPELLIHGINVISTFSTEFLGFYSHMELLGLERWFSVLRWTSTGPRFNSHSTYMATHNYL